MPPTLPTRATCRKNGVRAPDTRGNSDYPDEDAKLSACTDISILDRLAFGILGREGLRASELRELAWREVDLDRGTIALDVNKTDDPRSWVLDPGVLRALRLWQKLFHEDAQPDEFILVHDGCRFDLNKLAKRLRDALKRARVQREALFSQSEQRMHLRAHDLRGTFVTLALADGKTETWVADRTGHKSSAMINRYRRAARSAAELHLGWLRPLDRLIPELRKGTEKARRLTIAR
ncbi:MAG: site-specific integrase [Polyangiaceae bacterium]|nr:site-specific integrase [Polyangiaceae bacterium]